MVFFMCDACQTTLKKQKVESHKRGACASSSVSCIDCSVVFYGREYVKHTSCISEAEKYQGALYQGKKGGKKNPQQEWMEQVSRAEARTNDSSIKKALNRISEYENCPRKEKKFMNFVKNSLRLSDGIVSSVWKILEEVKAEKALERKKIEEAENARRDEIRKLREAKEKQKKLEKKRRREEKKASESSERKQKKVKLDQDTNNNNTDEKKTEKFNWKKSMKEVLKAQADQQFKLKKLQKVVIASYQNYMSGRSKSSEKETDEELKALFLKKLTKAHKDILVDGKIVTLKQ